MSWSEIESLISADEIGHLKEELSDELKETDLPTQFYKIGSVDFFVFRSLYHQNGHLESYCEKFLFVQDKVFKYGEGDFEVFSAHQFDFVDQLFHRLEKLKEIVLLYGGELEKLEDQLFERKASSAFLNDWFDLKKVMAKMERTLGRQLFILKDVIKSFELKEEGKDIALDYSALNAEVSYLYHTVQGSLGRLDNLHNFFSSLKDEKMNRNIYFLTVLSGLFLPLNLIVGFFGMNTQNLFFSENPQGTFYVIYILLGIVGLVFLGFNALRFIDRVFVKWWLGRTKFYHRLNSRIEAIEERWRF